MLSEYRIFYAMPFLRDCLPKSSYRTDKLKGHIARQHTENPLQLELSKDVQRLGWPRR